VALDDLVIIMAFRWLMFLYEFIIYVVFACVSSFSPITGGVVACGSNTVGRLIDWMPLVASV
jgi:hypothetical protein